MTYVILLLTLLVPIQQEFRSFSFCREGPQGFDERWCVELDSSGEGTFGFDSVDAGLIEEPLALTEGATETFLGLLAATDYLQDGDQYESGRRVANLGLKTLTAEGVWGRREAVFNYSDRKEVQGLLSFLEKLITQGMFLIDIDIALEFDRLGVPRKLEELSKSLSSEGIADPRGLLPILDRVSEDPRLVNFSRTQATRLKAQIEENY